MTIIERHRLINEILEEDFTFNVTVKKLKGQEEYTAYNDDYPDLQDYIYPTLSDAVGYLAWEIVDSKLKENNHDNHKTT